MLATPVIGNEAIDDLVIYTIARHGSRYSGIMVALNKETGDEVWTKDMQLCLEFTCRCLR